jgi:hypothetical protein
MALSKVNFNSMNVTPSASKAIKFNSGNNGLETGDIGGSMVLISEQTASSSANISFTSGIDSTYKEYIFKFIDIHPSADNINFTFNMSIDSGSNYNVTKTTSFFEAYHKEDDSDQYLAIADSRDLAQSTAFQQLNGAGVQNEDDGSISGYLQIFEPSSTTFVKHFISSSMSNAHNGNYCWNSFVAGYGNTTSAVDAIQFKMSSGNIDSGTIKMYGVS